MDEKLLHFALMNTKQLLGKFDLIINHINENKGQFSLPENLSKFYENIKHISWSSYYENQNKMQHLPIRFVLDSPDFVAYLSESKNFSPEQQLSKSIELCKLAQQRAEYYSDDIFNFTFLFDENFVTSEELKKTATIVLLYWDSFLTQAFQFIALYTYGQSMCDLVSDAKAGDDKAFIKAITIDRTVLYGIPYFQNKLITLQLGNDYSLLNKVSKAISKDTFRQDFIYPEANILFYILHNEGLLKQLSNKRLAKILEDLRIYSSHELSDISTLKSRFLKRQ